MKSVHALVAAVAVAGVAGVAAADQTVTFNSTAGSIGGTPFTAMTSNHGTFLTFCLEYNEDLDGSGVVVYDYVINTEALYNGGGLGNSDPLDSRSAFIYSMFRDGEIRNILGDQGLSDTRVANAIQIAIWDVEDEAVDYSFHADYANAQALITAAQDAIDDNDWVGLGNVRVMNNWVQGHIGEEDAARQDTLIIVPLPSAAALAGVGLFGLGAIRRRK